MEAVAKLKNCPYPARKMRLLADLVRNRSVEEAVNILRFHSKKMYAEKLEKLILSALANWEIINEEGRIDEANLTIKSICVDNARQLKRIRPAPQGRAHRIRKRSNHITVVVDSINDNEEVENIVNQETITE